ncbi:MAG: DUF2029 domain-containing protein [Tannerellaceae bacterium]|nr:DUF2029 domain-containing protein [Tannerellaceae bacterium]
MGKYNNYKIFKYVYWHAIEGLPLYKEYPNQYYDNNHYGIIFSTIIAPFAILPDWLGLMLWNVANTLILFYAIRHLPLTNNQKKLIYWFSFIELMTAQSVQQFNISVGAFILLSFIFIEKKKEFWAACIIVIGTFIKIYPIVGLAFFLFSKQKTKFILSLLFWSILFFFLPILYTSGFDYVSSQYMEWGEALKIKNIKNMFAPSQNVSLLGLVRKLTGISSYNDLCLIIPGLCLFFIPYVRVGQYKYLRFRLMILANVLLFVVLFSSGTEASGYIIAMIGVAIWYVCSPSKHRVYNLVLFIATLVIVGISTTEIVPRTLRLGFIQPFVLKSWMCIFVWFTICYESILLDFNNKKKNL